MVPPAPGAGRGGSSRTGSKTALVPRVSGPSGGAIVVRSHTGWGEYATFDPATGSLHSVPLAAGGIGGVYGDLAGVPVVFYRGASGLVLRVGDRSIGLDNSWADVSWRRIDGASVGFTVTVAGQIACDLRYRAGPPDLDLGLLISEVCADPDRRAQIFAR